MSKGIHIVSRTGVTHWSIDGSLPPCGSFFTPKYEDSWLARDGEMPSCVKCAQRDPQGESGDDPLLERIARVDKRFWPTQMLFGKWAGTSLDDLVDLNPEYARWVMRECSFASADLKAAFAWRMVKAGHPQRWIRDILRHAAGSARPNAPYSKPPTSISGAVRLPLIRKRIDPFVSVVRETLLAMGQMTSAALAEQLSEPEEKVRRALARVEGLKVAGTEFYVREDILAGSKEK